MKGGFDLDTTVATWRGFLSHDRSISADDADELESHLRDEIEELVAAEWTVEAAFEEAVRRVGDYATLETAYRDVHWAKQRSEYGIIHEITWRLSMLKNYLVTALRNVRRQKGYAFLNVAGLSIGLACSFFILLWVMHEASFDKFHQHGDRIYRVWRNVPINGEILTWGGTPGPLGEVLKKDFPDIDDAAFTLGDQDLLLTIGDETFREKGMYGSSRFFEVFTFPLLEGDPAQALQAKNSAVISERMAARLFGDDWRTRGVIGKTINVDHYEDFTVTGVAENAPDNSSVRFDVLLPTQAFFARNPWAQNWGPNMFQLYVRLREGASVSDVNAKIAGVLAANDPYSHGETLFLQSFEDMYLFDKFENGVNVGGRIDLIRIFSVVAVFLLVIAAINFMNLTTARASQRAREIGVRKAVGATHRSLVGQFMTESLLLSGIAFLLAMAFVIGLLPTFNLLTGKHIGVTDFSPAFLLALPVIVLTTGVLAGSYPAFYLSAFNPVSILRGTFRQKPGEARMRKGLVVFQFALSTLIIICTAAVYYQIRYIMEKDLGMDRENLVSVRLEGALRDRYETFRQELLKKPGVASITASDRNPLFIGSSTSAVAWSGKDPDDKTEFSIIFADYGFVETMRMQLVAGRTHARHFGADSVGYVINERTAKAMGKADPVGEKLDVWDDPGVVIGVVQDFHMTTLDAPIDPVIIRLSPPSASLLWMRTEPGRTQEALAGLEEVYRQFNPGYPFDYEFLDREYEQMYRSVLVMGKLANIFAVIAILISCLGLFGLASFTAERRTKEIGIRKVMGASASNLVMLLSMDFTKLVLLGFVLAAPVGYGLIRRFLGTFEYHVGISPLMFVTAGVATLVIAWLTVSYQSYKAAAANPVKSLRTE